MEKVSVALCTYNGEKFLFEQLKSIASQNYPVYEIIIIDDNSNDDTVKVIKKFQISNNINIKIIRNKKNIGVIKNFESAILKCTGDYIAFCDQDDIWKPQKIERIIAQFLKNTECGYVFSNASLIDEKGNAEKGSLWESIGFVLNKINKYNESNEQIQFMLNGGHFVYGMTMVFRAKYREQILPINSNSLECTHDTWTSLFLSIIGKKGIAVDELLVEYRQHDKQMFGAGKKNEKIQLLNQLKKLKLSINDNKIKSFNNLSIAVKQDNNSKFININSINFLDQMVIHLQNRSEIAKKNRIIRIYMVAREIFSGRYNKYSSSFMSALKDIIV